MRTLTSRRIAWVLLSRICTIIFPDFILKYLIGLNTPAARQAWREKITTCFLFIALVGLFLFWIEYISTLFCDDEDVVAQFEVFKNDSKYIAINGRAAEWEKYAESSPIAEEVSQYNGLDVSPMFPTFLMLDRSGMDNYKSPTLQRCIVDGTDDLSAQADKWLTYKLANDSGYQYNGNVLTCPYPNNTTVSGAPCYPYGYDRLPYKGDIIYKMDDISNFTTLSSPDTQGKAYVVLNGIVLDVTDYLETATNIVEVSAGVYSRAFALDRMFLPLDVTTLLFISLGEDISDYFRDNVTNPEIYESCLNTLFFKGKVEDAKPSGCEKINPALWATMGVGLLYFLLKMHLAHLCRLRVMQRFLFSSTEVSSAMRNNWPHTILMVPCYAEPSNIIKQTLESLARSHYDDSKKLLLFVCDGITKSKQDSKETHVCVLELLGYSGTDDPVSQPYISLGQNRKRINYAKVYSGYYETGRNRVPYLVVVKVGAPRERALADCAPGNRGKRDSMVIILGFLERCMNLASNRMTPLEYELFNQCYSVLGINPRNFKYMLVTDADTQVQGDVVQKMVSRLEKDRKMLAISGHARPANPEQNITTMLQIFPLYQTFYSGLAYEAFLGTVISVNGGFVMYKLWTENVPEEPKSTKSSRWQTFKRISSTSTSQQTIRSHSKWPKVSDEINPFQDDSEIQSVTTGEESRLSLAPNAGIRPCCIHPTVLRGFAAPRPDTMHMQNVLLLGEEQYLGAVLLRSHPQHKLGFEPEAVGYVTLPTNIFALQALQSRNLRSTFHNQIEMHRIAWDVGIGCWIISVSKLLDMIFSVPIIIYLYSVYIRFFKDTTHLAYEIIAISFASLVVLHIVYFIVRRQFKYVLWFIFYGLFSVPLFAIWFPLVAVWCSDYSQRWYDVWPTGNGRRGRTHGVVDNIEDDSSLNDDGCSEQKQLSDEELVPRMRLNEFEVAEAEKAYQRAMQEAVALDSNFTGFTGFVSGRASIHSVDSRQSGSFIDQTISTPPVAQLRNNGHHSTRVGKSTTSGFKPVASVVDMYGTVRRQRDPFEDPSPTTSVRSGSLADPFASALDNPFDDGYAVPKQGQMAPSTYTEDMHRTRRQHSHIGKHKPSHSQSSYFTYSSFNTTNDEYPPYYPAGTSAIVDSGGFVSNTSSSAPTRSRSYSAESVIPADRCSINSTMSNTLSLASSNLSLDPEASLERSRYPTHPGGSMSGHTVPEEEGEEGRKSAFHSRVGLKIPGHPGGLRGVGYGNTTSAAGSAAPPSNFSSRMRSSRRRRIPAESSLHHRDTSDTSHRATELATLPRTVTTTKDNNGGGGTSSSSSSSNNNSSNDLRGSIEQEIHSYLGSADLDSTTRAQVKQHLYSAFGDRIERDENLQEFINKSIEDITLQLLTRPSAP